MSDQQQAFIDPGIAQWIQRYLVSLIDELHPHGAVLEVGFASGHAAKHIQSYRPKSHIIIEEDPVRAKQAKEWARDYPHVEVIQGPWQTVLQGLKTFNTIFFDEGSHHQVVHAIVRHTPQEVMQAAETVQQLLATVEERLSKLNIRFSDQQIEDFYQQVGQFNPHELPKFLSSLKKYGQITEEQYEKSMHKYCKNEIKQEPASSAQPPSTLLLFLKTCLDKHMIQGSRFSCFLSDMASKYEDAQFFEQIITNPHVEYSEKPIAIKMPPCKLEEALILTVEKK